MKEEEFNLDSEAFFEVDAVDGGKIITRFDFNRYRLWFEQVIEREKLENVIDATEGGALIKGTKIMTLADAIEQECDKEVHIPEIIAGIESCFDEEHQKEAVEYLCSLPEKIENVKLEIRRARKEYKKLEKLCKQKRFREQDYIKKCKRVNKLVEDIQKRPETYLIIESLRGMDYAVRSVVLETEDNIQKEGFEVARYGQFMLKHMEQCAEVVRECAEEVMQELKECPQRFQCVSRAEENKDDGTNGGTFSPDRKIKNDGCSGRSD